MLLRGSIIVFAAACGAGLPADGAGDYFPDAGMPATCISSSECPTGYVCTDLHVCQAPSPPGDGGVPPPPETEIQYAQPISSQRFVYVAMTAQDELARIDGQTLAVQSRTVGEA